MKRITPVLLSLMLGILSPAWGQGQGNRFPHRRHENLFPTCGSCHAGITAGTPGNVFPRPRDCANCHDGTRERRIDWAGPTPHPTNLVFRHVDHAQRVVAEGDSATCLTCHQSAQPVGRMDVGGARPQACLTCHPNDSGMHLASSANCRLCHMPLAEATGFDETWVANLPKLQGHDDPTFLTSHAPADGSTARCAVCHARESCQRCHLNAAEIPVIAQLPTDPRVAALVIGKAPEYPTPASHRGGQWKWQHAERPSAGYGSCGNCHAQTSCRTCHVEARFSPIDSLPKARPGGPPGVSFGDQPPTVHAPGFQNNHDAIAAAAGSTCTNCHADGSFCVDCHQGPGRPAFHFPDYLERHSADAYGAEANCTSCHSTEVFCRSCHAGQGLASDGRLDVAFHTGKPFWLLGHGEAARQGLSNCAACHAENDCTQCHSAVGAWRINPHGPDFDPSRWRDRNPFTCLRCHSQVPDGSP
jgi:hypothetical protein